MRKIFADLGMSQQEIAERVGIAQATVSRHITGTRGMLLSTAQKYSQALGIPLEQVVKVAQEAKKGGAYDDS